MANNKKWLYAIPLVAGLIALYAILHKKKPSIADNTKKSGNGGTMPTDKAPVKSPAKSTVTQSVYPLKKGSKGDLVVYLQTAIGASNLPKYGIDGDFGTETENAVKKYLLKKTVASNADVDKIIEMRIKKGEIVLSPIAVKEPLVFAPSTPIINIFDANKIN